MDDDEYTEVELSAPSYPIRRGDIPILALTFLGNILSATEALVNDARDLLVADYNHRIDRERFHQDAALELESLTNGEDDD